MDWGEGDSCARFRPVRQTPCRPWLLGGLHLEASVVDARLGQLIFQVRCHRMRLLCACFVGASPDFRARRPGSEAKPSSTRFGCAKHHQSLRVNRLPPMRTASLPQNRNQFRRAIFEHEHTSHNTHPPQSTSLGRQEQQFVVLFNNENCLEDRFVLHTSDFIFHKKLAAPQARSPVGD